MQSSGTYSLVLNHPDNAGDPFDSESGISAETGADIVPQFPLVCRLDIR